VARLGVRAGETLQPLDRAAEALRSGDHQRAEAAQRQQMPGGRAGSGVVGGAHARDLTWLDVPVVDQHDRQAPGVQGGDVVERALGLDDQQAVEALGGDLRTELAHRLVAAVAGEQEQAVPLGLQHVDRALQHLADPRPGERGHQHADHPGAPAGQTDRTGTRHVAQFLDHLANPGGGGLVQLTLAVEHTGHGRLADLGPRRDVGDGDRHWSSGMSGRLPRHFGTGFGSGSGS
jgi:hypothetical protein